MGEFPWQVELLGRENVLAQFCGGSLITDRHVLTAAHCTDGRSASSTWVGVGEYDLLTNDLESLISAVAAVKQHPEYNSATTQNDICILQLAIPISLTSKPFIKPICLPPQDAKFWGQDVVVSGWGTIRSDGPASAILNKVELKLEEEGTCGQLSISEDMICAGVDGGGKDSCQGDSGGPLVVNLEGGTGGATQVGVVSFGRGCAQENFPGAYAEVAHFRNWIDAQIGDGITCPPPSG